MNVLGLRIDRCFVEKFASCLSIVACFTACGDDSNLSANTGNSGSVDSIYELGKCSAESKGTSFFVESEDAFFLCDGKSWKRVSDDDSTPGKNDPSKDDSKGKSSSSDEEEDDSLDENIDADEPESSSARENVRSSSSVVEKPVQSRSSSSVAKPVVSEVADRLDLVEFCNEHSIGTVVFIQSEKKFYVCNGDEYVEEDSSDGSSSSKGDASASSSSSQQSLLPIVLDDCQEILDSRDGTTYGVVSLGSLCLMAENLNYVSNGGNADDKIASWCYENEPDNCDYMGRLYTWAAAMDLPQKYNLEFYQGTFETLDGRVQGLCPDGFYMPTENDWKFIERYIHTINLKPSGQYLTDADEYSSAGFSNGLNAENGNLFQYSTPFWTSKQYGAEVAGHWYSYWLGDRVDNLGMDYKRKNSGFAVRCLHEFTPPQTLVCNISGVKEVNYPGDKLVYSVESSGYATSFQWVENGKVVGVGDNYVKILDEKEIVSVSVSANGGDLQTTCDEVDVTIPITGCQCGEPTQISESVYEWSVSGCKSGTLGLNYLWNFASTGNNMTTARADYSSSAMPAPEVIVSNERGENLLIRCPAAVELSEGNLFGGKLECSSVESLSDDGRQTNSVESYHRGQSCYSITVTKTKWQGSKTLQIHDYNAPSGTRLGIGYYDCNGDFHEAINDSEKGISLDLGDFEEGSCEIVFAVFENSKNLSFLSW